MTEYFDDDSAYDDGYEEEPRQKGPGPKALREALKAKEKQLKDFEAELGKLRDRERTRTVAGVLSAKGINSKVAELIPADVGADEDAVTEWVTKYADVFGVATDDASGSQGTDAAGASTIPPEDQMAMSRINQAATSGVPPESRYQEVMDKLNNASYDDVLAMIEAERRGSA